MTDHRDTRGTVRCGMGAIGKPKREIFIPVPPASEPLPEPASTPTPIPAPVPTPEPVPAGV
ncbi:MAG TPA: hypothetical protein VFZ17_12515 [Acidimicrobiia bacterium]|nr:hypothetical protein [Acidimicrobiia bacterium]